MSRLLVAGVVPKVRHHHSNRLLELPLEPVPIHIACDVGIPGDPVGAALLPVLAAATLVVRAVESSLSRKMLLIPTKCSPGWR
jgi:hypothetical protein